MTKQQLKQAIKSVAETTGATEKEVADKMQAKDHWTWFLIRQSA